VSPLDESMSPLALSGIIFALLLAGIFVGAVLRKALPKAHLSKDTQDVVRLGAGLIATIGGLLLGLLIASAKSSYDTESTQVKQITADLILLDNLLAKYGPEALPIRNQMRSAIGSFVDRMWRSCPSKSVADSIVFEMVAADLVIECRFRSDSVIRRRRLYVRVSTESGNGADEYTP
jgi:hypothetical protein